MKIVATKIEHAIVLVSCCVWFLFFPAGLIMWHITDNYRYFVVAIGAEIIFYAVAFIKTPKEPSLTRIIAGTLVSIIFILLSYHLWI